MKTISLPKNAYCDPDLLQREYYNPNKFEVSFVRNSAKDLYILNSGKALGPEVAILKPDEFLYLPHGYYTATGKGLEHGEPFKLIVNLERMMFRGNKTPSNIYGING